MLSVVDYHAQPEANQVRGIAARWSADDALTHMYAQEWSSLVRLSYLLVRDQQVAEEVTQDAFVAMHDRWHRLREPDLARAYLRATVVNRSRSVLRRRKVERGYLDGAKRAAVAARSSESSAEDRVVAGEQSASLLDRLGELPRRQREVLVLRYYLDLSEAQISQTLSISPGSVKAHAHRGLAALRGRMEERR